MQKTKARGILIAGNWKMNFGPEEIWPYFAKLRALSPASLPGVRACILPPFVSLQESQRFAAQILSIPIIIGAQNAHWEKKGAFTGEISGPMLQQLGIQCVLVGHSERRQFFGETDATVRLRAESLLNQGFQVIVCVGETRQERDLEKTQEVLHRQLSVVLGNSPENFLKLNHDQLILAYEPVWAIGTGLTATPAQAEESHQLIRNFIRDRLGPQAANEIPLLYGGSVTPENCESLFSCPNIDGALVGGASLKADGFLALLESAAKVLRKT